MSVRNSRKDSGVCKHQIVVFARLTPLQEEPTAHISIEITENHYVTAYRLFYNALSTYIWYISTLSSEKWDWYTLRVNISIAFEWILKLNSLATSKVIIWHTVSMHLCHSTVGPPWGLPGRISPSYAADVEKEKKLLWKSSTTPICGAWSMFLVKRQHPLYHKGQI